MTTKPDIRELLARVAFPGSYRRATWDSDVEWEFHKKQALAAVDAQLAALKEAYIGLYDSEAMANAIVAKFGSKLGHKILDVIAAGRLDT